MMAHIEIDRAGPLVSVQDFGRHGHLIHGVSASGPMDAGAFEMCGSMLGTSASSGLEFTSAGLDFTLHESSIDTAFCGGDFSLFINENSLPWNCVHSLGNGDRVRIEPGGSGNYGYLRFDAELDVPLVLGSRATNTIVGLGGFEGRALKSGDKIGLIASTKKNNPVRSTEIAEEDTGPIRFVWGIHAMEFSNKVRAGFVENIFAISSSLNRMGVRLNDESGIFKNANILSLVSEPVVPGDIQILGDGTPVILMRDHQPTGGYPRIGTLVSADFDRFSQLRPGTEISFSSVTVEHAHSLLKQRRKKYE